MITEQCRASCPGDCLNRSVIRRRTAGRRRLLKFKKSQKLQGIRCHSEFFFLKAPKTKIFVF